MTSLKATMLDSTSNMPRPVSQESLPPYQPGDEVAMELGPLRSSLSSSALSLPQYDAVVAKSSSSSASSSSFYPSVTLQVETTGVGIFRLPLPPRNIPIPVYAVEGMSGEMGGVMYESIRPTRGSGNCALFRRGDGDSTVVCNTTYRFGLNRPPVIQLAADDDNNNENEGFEVHGKGIATRAIRIRTSMGTFQWRYASRVERKAFASGNSNNSSSSSYSQQQQQEIPNSLLLMERVHSVALSGAKKSTEERLRTVAMLVRGESTRTRGSGSSSAGNGGRLLLDLRDCDVPGSDSKGKEARQMEAFVIASCLVMLKREIDRRRVQQAMMLSAGAHGGS